MKISKALQSISLYPLTTSSVSVIATECGLDPEAEVTAVLLGSKAYKRAKSQVYQYLSEAPNVTEGGATYSFSEDERKEFRKKALQLLSEIDDDEANAETECGYFGEDF